MVVGAQMFVASRSIEPNVQTDILAQGHPTPPLPSFCSRPPRPANGSGVCVDGRGSGGGRLRIGWMMYAARF